MIIFPYEATENDNNDGGPSKGGELLIAISPEVVAGQDWKNRSEQFMQKLLGLDGVRIPGQRRHANRLDTGPREINAELLEKIRSLC